jgi:hypothetical protein
VSEEDGGCHGDHDAPLVFVLYAYRTATGRRLLSFFLKKRTSVFDLSQRRFCNWDDMGSTKGSSHFTDGGGS